MTDVGDYILVESDEAQQQLPTLLEHVMAGRHVRICKDGRTVAEMQPPPPVHDRLQLHPKLTGVQFNEDPAAPLEDEDWSEDLR